MARTLNRPGLAGGWWLSRLRRHLALLEGLIEKNGYRTPHDKRTACLSA